MSAIYLTLICFYLSVGFCHCVNMVIIISSFFTYRHLIKYLVPHFVEVLKFVDCSSYMVRITRQCLYLYPLSPEFVC
jgi:hypothetical protein